MDLCRNPTLQQTPESSIPSLECQTYSSQISLHLHHRVTCNILSLGHWQVPISQSFSVKNVTFPSNYKRKWYFHWDMRHIHSLKKWSEVWIGRRAEISFLCGSESSFYTPFVRPRVKLLLYLKDFNINRAAQRSSFIKSNRLEKFSSWLSYFQDLFVLTEIESLKFIQGPFPILTKSAPETPKWWENTI